MIQVIEVILNASILHISSGIVEPSIPRYLFLFSVKKANAVNMMVEKTFE